VSDLETQIAADYGVEIEVEGTGIDEPWNTDQGGVGWINAISEGSGQVVAWLGLGLVFVFAADVISRSFFDDSISWANDFGYFLYSIHFVIGAAYTLKRSGHIRTDFVYRNWSAKTQAKTDAFVYGVLFIPALIAALWIAIDKGANSFRLREEVITSNSGLPLWVLKVALPIGLFLWLLQSFSELVKSIRVVREGEWRRGETPMTVPLTPLFALAALLIALRVFAKDFLWSVLDGIGGVLHFLFGWLADLLSGGNVGSALSFIPSKVLSPLQDQVPNEWLGIIMLMALFGAIVVGFPIAQTLLVMSFGFGFVGFGDNAFNLFANKANETMTDVTLAAVPMFLLMGFVLEQAGLMDRLFRALQLSMANLRGSLYLAVIAAATIFAAATGIVGASVTLIGLMAIPSMTRSGYDVRMSAGAITAGGTLGILIPPSIMLVVMAPVVGVKVLDLFAAAILPGIMLSALYTGYAMIRARRNPELGPPLPEEERADNVGEIVREIVLGIIPPLVLITLTLGSILWGFATPTEASAMGALGSILLATLTGKLSVKMISRALMATLETGTMIMILIVASNFFGAVFSRLGSAGFVADGLVSLDLPWIVMLGLILLFVFVLGWPLEWVPIVLIFIPILLPVVIELNIDLVWFSILVAVTLQTAWLSPPVALSAYFLKGVAPHWDLKDIYAGMFQFMGLQVLGLVLVLLFPALALWLPEVLN